MCTKGANYFDFKSLLLKSIVESILIARVNHTTLEDDLLLLFSICPPSN